MTSSACPSCCLSFQSEWLPFSFSEQKPSWLCSLASAWSTNPATPLVRLHSSLRLLFRTEPGTIEAKSMPHSQSTLSIPKLEVHLHALHIHRNVHMQCCPYGCRYTINRFDSHFLTVLNATKMHWHFGVNSVGVDILAQTVSEVLLGLTNEAGGAAQLNTRS